LKVKHNHIYCRDSRHKLTSEYCMRYHAECASCKGRIMEEEKVPEVINVTRSYRIHGGGVLRETIQDGVEVIIDGKKFVRFITAGDSCYAYVPFTRVSLQLPEEPCDRSVVLSTKNEAWQRNGTVWYYRTTAASWEVLNRTEGPLRVLYDA
jgi:hypothetical protein